MLEALLRGEVRALDHKSSALSRRRLLNRLIRIVCKLVLHELSVVKVGSGYAFVLLVLRLELLRGHVELVLDAGGLREFLKVAVAGALGQGSGLRRLLAVRLLTVRSLVRLGASSGADLRQLRHRPLLN